MSPTPLVPRPFLKISFFFFFEKFGNLEFFHGIENFDFFFFEKCRSLEFFSRSWKLWLIDFFFLVENLNFSKEFKILKFFFFFEKFGSLEFFHGIENFDFFFFFFFEKFGNLEFFYGIENFDWFFFFWENLEILNFFVELKILILIFFFFKAT